MTAPRGYAVHGIIGPAESGLTARKCLLCGHKNYVHAMLKVGVRHYVHARCAIDNDPSILARMPDWVFGQLPIAAFDGQPHHVLNEAIRRTREMSR